MQNNVINAPMVMSCSHWQAAEQNNSEFGLFGPVVNSMSPWWAFMYCSEMFCRRHNIYMTEKLLVRIVRTHRQ